MNDDGYTDLRRTASKESKSHKQRAPTVQWRNILITVALLCIIMWLVLLSKALSPPAAANAPPPPPPPPATAAKVTRLRTASVPDRMKPPQKPPLPETAAAALNAPSMAVLIVLGNEPLDDQTPTVDTMNRVQKAVDYYKARPPGSTLLIFTGGPTAGTKTEALTMSEYAQRQGVPLAAIRLEEKARSTKQNALLSARLLLREGVRPTEVYVVSKADHLRWALPLFKARDVPGQLFQGALALPSSVTKEDVMRQMQQYIADHPDGRRTARVQLRLDMLKKGVQGID